MRQAKRFFLLLTCGLLLTAQAAECVWTGEAGDCRWSSAANWTVAPQSGGGDTVVIDIGDTTAALTNDIAGLSLAQLRLLGNNDSTLTLSGNAITLNPSGVKGTFPAFTNHCSLVLDTPLRVSSSCMLAFYGQKTTVNGNLTIDDNVTLRLRSRIGTVRSAGGTLVGTCKLAFNGRIDGPKSELRLILGGNGNGVEAPFNAPVRVAAFYLGGENTAQGTARLKASDNDIGRVVFAATPLYLDADNSLTTNTVIELGRYPTGSVWYWGSPRYASCAGIVIAPNTMQVANRMDGRPVAAKYGGQRVRSVDEDKRSCEATLRLRGTTNAVTYVTLSDLLKVEWDPVGDFTQDFCDALHDCYGGLAVRRGTLRSSGTNSFVRMRTLSIGANAAFEAASTNPLGVLPNLNALDMAKGAVFRVTGAAASQAHIVGTNAAVTMAVGAKFVLPAGAAIMVNVITNDGQRLKGETTYTGMQNANPGQATVVDWIEGEGTVTVGDGHEGRAPYVIDIPAGDGGLADAFKAVKTFRKTDVDTPLVLSLAPGDHCLNGAQISLSYEHTRNVWAPLTIRAADAGNLPRILGGFAVTNGWTTGLFPGRDDVWSADVTALTNQFAADTFWFDGKVMTWAQWPNRNANRPHTSGFAFVDATYGSITTTTGWYLDELPIRAGDNPPDWANPSEGRIRACPRHNWSASYYSVISVSNGLIRIKNSHEPPEDQNHIWDRFTMIGQRENLDQAGEWYLDKENRLLHFIPPDGKDPNTGYAALCADGAAITVEQGENISFERLDFTCTREAMRICSLSDRVAVRACRFHHLGGFDSRAVISTGSSNVTISDCDFYHIGATAVSISDSLKTCNGRSNQRVENCYIHHVGETHPHGAGVSLGGQGNAVVHNLIHDTGRCGISGYGRFNEIAYNRVRHANVTSDDTSCIYGGGWNDGVGVRIHHNWVSDDLGYDRHASSDQKTVYYTHHSNQAWGIYLDEADGGTEISCNLVTGNRNCGAMHLHSARWATITNNIFAQENCGTKMMSFQSWRASTLETRTNKFLRIYNELLAADPGWTNYPAFVQSPRCDETTYCDDGTVMMGHRVERNIFYYASAKTKPAHACSNFNLVTNRFDYNLYWPGELAGTMPEDRVYVSNTSPKTNHYFKTWQTGPKEDVHSLVADPQFVTAGGVDGKLQATSPAFALGIAPLDVADKAGLEITEWRTELPTEEEGVREHPEYLSEATTWTAGSGAWGAATNWDFGVPHDDGVATIPANVAGQTVTITNTDAFQPARLTVGASGDENVVTMRFASAKYAPVFSGSETVFAGNSVLLNTNSVKCSVCPKDSGSIARLTFKDHARFANYRYESFSIGHDAGSGVGEAVVEFASDAKHTTLGYGVYVGSPNGTGTLNVCKGYLPVERRCLRIGSGNGNRYSSGKCKNSGGHGTLNVSGGALVLNTGSVVSEGQMTGIVVGESSSHLSEELKQSYIPWQGWVNLSGGVITNKSNCLIGGARGTGSFVQTGGRYEHPYQKSYRFPFIVGCAGGTGDCQFLGGTANIVGDVYVGGIFTNAIMQSGNCTNTLGYWGWPVDDHTAVGKLTYGGGNVTVTGNVNLGFDGTGTLVFGGAEKMTIKGDLVLSNAIVRIEKQGGQFCPLYVTGKIVNSANARFSIDRDSFEGVADNTLIISAGGGWEGPEPVLEDRGVALKAGANGLSMSLMEDIVASIEMIDGAPAIYWSPYRNSNSMERLYRIWGKDELADPEEEWRAARATNHFFKVSVEMPNGVDESDVPGPINNVNNLNKENYLGK